MISCLLYGKYIFLLLSESAFNFSELKYNVSSNTSCYLGCRSRMIKKKEECINLANHDIHDNLKHI